MNSASNFANQRTKNEGLKERNYKPKGSSIKDVRPKMTFWTPPPIPMSNIIRFEAPPSLFTDIQIKSKIFYVLNVKFSRNTLRQSCSIP